MGLWRQLAAVIAGDDEMRGKRWFTAFVAFLFLLFFSLFISIIVMLLKH